MESSEVLEGLTDRVEALELVVGNVDGLVDEGLVKKVAFVACELRKVLRDGRGYSDQLWQLLEVYAAGDHGREEDHLVMLHTILGRFSEIRGTLRELQKLDMACSELARQDVAGRTDVVEIDKLVQLPGLAETCNRLLVRTLSLVQRFIAWNEHYNEFYREFEGKVRQLENEIDSI